MTDKQVGYTAIKKTRAMHFMTATDTMDNQRSKHHDQEQGRFI